MAKHCIHVNKTYIQSSKVTSNSLTGCHDDKATPTDLSGGQSTGSSEPISNDLVVHLQSPFAVQHLVKDSFTVSNEGFVPNLGLLPQVVHDRRDPFQTDVGAAVYGID